MTIEIRHYQPEDCRPVFELLCNNGWQQRIKNASWFDDLMSRSDDSFVAISGGRVVGFVRSINDGMSNGYISMLVVSSDQRRRGIGRSLVQQLTEQSPNVTWVLRAGRAGAMQFFERLGFNASVEAMESNRH